MKLLVRIALLLCISSPLGVSGSQDRIAVGVIYDASFQTEDGVSLDLLSARFAIDDLNREGNLLGKQVDLVELDNSGTPIGSRIAAEKAVAAGVIAVVGPSKSSHAMQAGAVLQAAGIPMITPFATNPDVTLLGDCVFRICFQDQLQGLALADFAIHNLKAKTAVVLTCVEEKYSIDLSEILETSFREYGGTILWHGEYLSASTDFREMIQKAAACRPAVIFLPGYNRTSGFIIRQTRNMGEDVIFLGGDAWSDNMYRYGGASIEGCYYSGQWRLDAENEKTREFVGRYKKRYSDTYIASFGLFHDAVFLLADAVHRANSFEPAAIQKALEATTAFQGVTGTISMDRNGDPVKPIPFFKFEKGSSVFATSVAP